MSIWLSQIQMKLHIFKIKFRLSSMVIQLYVVVESRPDIQNRSDTSIPSPQFIIKSYWSIIILAHYRLSLSLPRATQMIFEEVDSQR